MKGMLADFLALVQPGRGTAAHPLTPAQCEHQAGSTHATQNMALNDKKKIEVTQNLTWAALF